MTPTVVDIRYCGCPGRTTPKLRNQSDSGDPDGAIQIHWLIYIFSWQ